MKEISKLSEKALEQLDKGAFLVCNTAGGVNVMTIGWGSIGYYVEQAHHDGAGALFSHDA